MAATAVQDVNNYLSTKQSEADKECASEWAQLEELYNKKLWHQLTLKLSSFVKHPSLQDNENLIQLYNNFIQTFENKMNPLSLVEIIAFIVVQFPNKRDAIEFLKKSEEKVKSNNEAVALCKVLSGQILLESLNDQEGTKKLLKMWRKCWMILMV